MLEQRDDQKEAERIKRLVYAEVDIRDGKRCRCCGRRGNPHATTALGRIHRHHLLERGKDQGPMIAWNILSLCWICHALIHSAKQLFVIGKNANIPVRFEIKEAAVVEVFGTRELPKHVRIIV